MVYVCLESFALIELLWVGPQTQYPDFGQWTRGNYIMTILFFFRSLSAISSIISKTLLDRSVPEVIGYAGILVSITWLTATD